MTACFWATPVSELYIHIYLFGPFILLEENVSCSICGAFAFFYRSTAQRALNSTYWAVFEPDGDAMVGKDRAGMSIWMGDPRQIKNRRMNPLARFFTTAYLTIFAVAELLAPAAAGERVPELSCGNPALEEKPLRFGAQNANAISPE